MEENSSTPSPALCARLEGMMERHNEGFQSPAERHALIGLYAIVCILGFLGNAFVLLSAAKFPQLRTLRNAFILNLATSDLFLASISAPLTLFMVANRFWPFGDALCRVISAAQSFNLFLSTLSLAGIGLDRVLLVLFPVRFRTKSGAATGVVLAGVWLTSALLASPYFLAVQVIDVPGNPYSKPEFRPAAASCGLSMPQVCIEVPVHPLFGDNRLYSLFCFLFQYLVPLLVLSATYSRVCRTLFGKPAGNLRPLASARAARASEDQAAQKRSQMLREKSARKRRTALLMTGLVVSFALCWLPWNLYMTLSNFGVLRFSATQGFIQCHLFGLLIAIVNPVLYGVYNENFRAAYSNLLSEVRSKASSIRTPRPQGSPRTDRQRVGLLRQASGDRAAKSNGTKTTTLPREALLEEERPESTELLAKDFEQRDSLLLVQELDDTSSVTI